LYWCVAALGLIDVDVLDAEMGTSLEDASFQPEGLAGLLLKFGLSGVPVTLVLTLLFFFSWLFCYFAQLLVLRFLPLGMLRYPLGLVLTVAALLLAVPICRALVRPLRPLFLKLHAPTHRSLLGQVA